MSNERPLYNDSFLIDPLAFHSWLQENNHSKINNTNNISLEKNLDLRIIDLSSESSYLEGHIIGAIHVPFQTLMGGQAPAVGRLPNKERLNQLFSYLGLTDNTHFVVYDDEGGGWAGRFIWTLDVIGHKHYSYIDGGILAWRQENLPTESTPNHVQTTEVSVEINHSTINPIAEIPDILEGLQQEAITIWDARSPMEYKGEHVFTQKGGHIPGAINCEWTSLMDRNSGMRLRKDAENYLNSLGLNAHKRIVTHCQSHHRSAYTYMIGKLLGFKIRAYHGSWSEWGNHPNTPVEI